MIEDAAISTSTSAEAARGQRFGWYVVLALFVMLTVNAGFGFYALGSYASYLGDHAGLSLTGTSIGSTVFMLCSGFGGVLVARAVTRYSVATAVLASAVLSAVMLPLIGLVHGDVTLWVVYLVFGIGSAGNSVIAASALIMEWFGDRPARAIALATTGMSVGGALVAPVVEAMVQGMGLFRSGLIEGGVTLVVLIPLSHFVLRRPPSFTVEPAPGAAARIAPLATAGAPGQVPQSTPSTIPGPVRSDPGAGVAADAGVLAGDPAVAGPSGGGWRFAAVCVIFGLMFTSQVGTVTHLLLLAAERSISDAALALTVLAGTSVIARLGAIPLLPLVGVRRFTVVVAVIQAGAMATLALAHSREVLYLGAFLLGITVANAIVLLPLWVLEVCGRDGYSARYARANLATSVGTGIAPALTGVLHSAFSGYTGPFLVLAAGSAVAGAVSLVLGLAPSGRPPLQMQKRGPSGIPRPAGP